MSGFVFGMKIDQKPIVQFNFLCIFFKLKFVFGLFIASQKGHPDDVNDDIVGVPRALGFGCNWVRCGCFILFGVLRSCPMG